MMCSSDNVCRLDNPEEVMPASEKVVQASVVFSCPAAPVRIIPVCLFYVDLTCHDNMFSYNEL